MLIPHKIIRGRRKTIMLHITPDAKLVVYAPHLVPKFFIDRFIEEKNTWIEKKISEMKKRGQQKIKTFTEGEALLFLGNKLSLTYTQGIDISVKENKLLFPKALQFRVKKELENWYRKQAKDIIINRLKYHAKNMNTEYTSVMFSDTKSKWGTCFHDNSLQFNWRLVMAPLIIIDYVIIHELSHTTKKNHSRDFWNKVRLYTPAYKQHREWLNRHGNELIYNS